MNNNYYAVIMAGGVGSRFWPMSTQENPKQFHDMLGAGKSLIQKTFDRLAKTIPSENILVKFPHIASFPMHYLGKIQYFIQALMPLISFS